MVYILYTIQLVGEKVQLCLTQQSCIIFIYSLNTRATQRANLFLFLYIAIVCGVITDHAPSCIIIIVWTHYNHTFEVAYNCVSLNKLHHCLNFDFCILYSYRPVGPPPGAGNSKVLSTSLPSSTHLDTSTASASPGIPTILSFGTVVWPLHLPSLTTFYLLHLGKFRLSCNINEILPPLLYIRCELLRYCCVYVLFHPQLPRRAQAVVVREPPRQSPLSPSPLSSPE